MIEKATSAREVDRLAKILETGDFPEEGLDGEEKVEVKKDDDGEEGGKEMKMVENGSSASERPTATVHAVPTPPPQTEEKNNNIDMEVEEPKSSTTTATTPTKAQAKRKGRTPTRKVKAAGRDEKEGSKESFALPKTPPPTPISDNDNKEVQAMDAEGPGTSDRPVLTENEIKAMTVAVLKKTLKARDEPTTGLKKELQARLLVSCGHAAD